MFIRDFLTETDDFNKNVISSYILAAKYNSGIKVASSRSDFQISAV